MIHRQGLPGEPFVSPTEDDFTYIPYPYTTLPPLTSTHILSSTTPAKSSYLTACVPTSNGTSTLVTFDEIDMVVAIYEAWTMKDVDVENHAEFQAFAMDSDDEFDFASDASHDSASLRSQDGDAGVKSGESTKPPLRSSPDWVTGTRRLLS